MKTIISSLAFLVALSPCLAKDNAGWFNLHPINSGFMVQMPVQPICHFKDITEDGITYRAYRYDAAKGEFTYTVAVADMSHVNIPQDQQDVLLQNVIDGIAKIGKYNVYQDDQVKVQGYPGRMFGMVDKNGIGTFGMTCWDGHHNYVISVRGPDAKINRDVTRPFFITFRIVPS